MCCPFSWGKDSENWGKMEEGSWKREVGSSKHEARSLKREDGRGGGRRLRNSSGVPKSVLGVGGSDG